MSISLGLYLNNTISSTQIPINIVQYQSWHRRCHTINPIGHAFRLFGTDADEEIMSIYSKWQDLCNQERDEQQASAFWNDYLEAEKSNYIKVLTNSDKVYEGTVTELAEEFGMTPEYMAGFIDGGNTSLTNAVDLEKLDDNTVVKLDFDFEKLYYNMLGAKAPWLYELEEWNDVLGTEKTKAISKQWKLDQQAVSTKVPRNAPCPCGSGKKYKKCCG